MKLQGADVATASGYLRDVLRTHQGLPMKYPCRAGKNIVCIDCNLDVFPCYKRSKLFNLRERQDLQGLEADNSGCDNKNCLINCFKEASLSSKGTMTRAVVEEIGANPKFYIKLLRGKNAA
jgi:hypothetical protein